MAIPLQIFCQICKILKKGIALTAEHVIIALTAEHVIMALTAEHVIMALTADNIYILKEEYKCQQLDLI